MSGAIEAAFGVFDNTADYRALLERVHDAVLTGSAAPARPRPVIEASWQRIRRNGLHAVPQSAPDPETAGRLLVALPALRDQTDPLIEDGRLLAVLTDASGLILWRDGCRGVRRRADRLGFVPERVWSETAVGTNAIGTALAERVPVQVHAAEHYASSHADWSCAASPIRDPRTGAPIGVIDLSCPADEANSTLVVLASSLAKLAEAELREQHRHELDRLRRRERVRTAGLGDDWALVDPWGWVADAASGESGRLRLPEVMGEGAVLVDRLGPVVAARLEYGWLLTREPASSAAPRFELGIEPFRCVVRSVADGDTAWTHVLTGRRAQLLAALAAHPRGCTAAHLAASVYGDEAREVTVRAELSRIRRDVGAIVLARPYRLAECVDVVAVG